jgi:hypothetical protein
MMGWHGERAAHFPLCVLRGDEVAVGPRRAVIARARTFETAEDLSRYLDDPEPYVPQDGDGGSGGFPFISLLGTL